MLGELRTIVRAKAWNRLDKFEAHFLRRGAATAILGARGSFARLLESGHWHSSPSQLYLDLVQEETQAMASILIASANDGH